MVDYVLGGRLGGKDQFAVDPPDIPRQESPEIARLEGGGYVVTWLDDRAVTVQLYDNDGEKVGAARPLTAGGSTTHNSDPSVAGLAGGGFAVAWSDRTDHVVVQLFDAAGQPVSGIFPAGGQTNYEQQPAIAGLANGDFVVAWTLNGSPTAIHARLFHASGAPASAEFTVYEHDFGSAFFPKIDALAGGGFVIGWTVDIDDEGGGTVRAQAYDAAAAPQGAPVRIDNVPSYFNNFYEAVAGLADGRYVLTWTAGDGGDESLVMAQICDVTGAKIGAAFQVNTDETYKAGQSDVTALDNGGFLVTWKLDVPDGGSNYFQLGEIKAQAFDAQGARVGEEFLVNQVTDSGQDVPAVTAFGTGDVAFAWHSFVHFSDAEIAARNFYSVTRGSSAADTLEGTHRIDILRGFGGNDILKGRAGADVMEGGPGDDIYHVDDHRDEIVELAGEGSDRVLSTTSFSLAGRQVESLTLTGRNATSATGNGLANILTGNVAGNRLDGGGGADTLAGGKGDDSYFIDDRGDRVIEHSGEGTDTVFASVGFSAGAQHIETIALTGSGDVHATGNALDNSLIGNSGDNRLNGGAGADTMTGRAGDDRYYVNHRGDRVVEAAGGGADTVFSSVSFSLAGQAIETLRLTGSGVVDGTGNDLANLIAGNSAANRLDGGGGGDRLHGGRGNDVLTGGAGADGFWFETVLGGGNVDHLGDFSPADDTIFLDRAVFAAIAADGPLAAGDFRVATAAGDPSDRIVYDQATGRIFYDSDGTGAAAQILFATVAPGTVLTHADFSAFI